MDISLIRKLASVERGRRYLEAEPKVSSVEFVTSAKLAAVEDTELLKIANSLPGDVLENYTALGGTFRKLGFGTPMFNTGTQPPVPMQSARPAQPRQPSGTTAGGGISAPSVPNATTPSVNTGSESTGEKVGAATSTGIAQMQQAFSPPTPPQQVSPRPAQASVPQTQGNRDGAPVKLAAFRRALVKLADEERIPYAKRLPPYAGGGVPLRLPPSANVEGAAEKKVREELAVAAEAAAKAKTEKTLPYKLRKLYGGAAAKLRPTPGTFGHMVGYPGLAAMGAGYGLITGGAKGMTMSKKDRKKMEEAGPITGYMGRHPALSGAALGGLTIPLALGPAVLAGPVKSPVREYGGLLLRGAIPGVSVLALNKLLRKPDDKEQPDQLD